MPPTLFAALSIPFTRLAYILFPAAMANGVISGAYTFCKPPYTYSSVLQTLTLPLKDVLYDCMHYAWVLSFKTLGKLMICMLIAYTIPRYPRTCVKWKSTTLLTTTRTSSSDLVLRVGIMHIISQQPTDHSSLKGKIWDYVFNTVLYV